MSPAARAAAQRSTLVALVAAIALTLAACSGGSDSTSKADSLTIADAWAKAADSGMTAAFAEVANSSTQDITIVSATSTSASASELQEVVDDVMRPVDGGFVIPAGETLSLEPGGYHLMFMGVTEPIVAGDEVTVTLTLDDDSELTFTAVAKDFSGANEEYDGEMDMGADPSMSPSAGMGD
jgi:copper(I)-binding protein